MLRLRKNAEIRPRPAVTRRGNDGYGLWEPKARGQGLWLVTFTAETAGGLTERSYERPILLGERTGSAYWLFCGKAYETENLDLSERDVYALLTEKANRDRLRLEKAHALLAMRENLDTLVRRQAIPQEVKVAVWQRDGGRCVDCGSQEELEYDHIIPLAMGGSNTERNLQLLCATCNRRKGATLG